MRISISWGRGEGGKGGGRVMIENSHTEGQHTCKLITCKTVIVVYMK